MMRYLAIALLLLNGISAMGGGYALMADATGSGVGMPIEWIENSIFHDYFIPGLYLFFVNGVANIAVAAAVWFKKGRYSMLTIMAGVALAIWLAVQIITIKQLSMLQFIYALVGFFMIFSGIAMRTTYNQDIEKREA
jgi:hypothetical protein